MAFNPLTGVLEALQSWQDNVVEDKVMGHGLRSARRLGTSTGPNPIGLFNMLVPAQAADAADQAGLQGKDWVDAAYKDAPFQRFITSAGMDPLNALGMGLPGKVASVLPQGSKLAAGFNALNKVDQLPGVLSGKAFDLFGQKVGAPLVSKVNQSLVKPMADFQTAHPTFTKNWQTGTQAWKEQVLTSIPRHLQDNIENVAKPAMLGDFATAADNIKTFFGGSGKWDELVANRWRGGHPPNVITSSASQTSPDSVYRGFKRGVPGWDQAMDGLGSLFEKNAAFSNRSENIARKSAFANEWQRAIDSGVSPQEATAQGMAYLQRLFPDYSANTPLHQVANTAMAFPKFSLHNLPFQIRESLARPAITNVPTNWYRTTDEYNGEHGLPGRMHGQMAVGRTPDGDDITIDPFRYLSIGQLVKAGTKQDFDDPGQNAFGDVGETLREMGLGLHPAIDTPMAVGGAYGRGFAPGYLRWSQPINGALGGLLGQPVDIEAPIKGLLGAAKEGITGSGFFPYQEYQVRKRAGELKATGQDPTMAPDQVGNQNAFEGLLNFLGTPSLKVLTEEERMIRSNQKVASDYFDAGNKAMGYLNPTAGAYKQLDPREEQIAKFNTLPPAEQERLLRDPEVRNALLMKLSRDLHAKEATGKKTSNPYGFGK